MPEPSISSSYAETCWTTPGNQAGKLCQGRGVYSDHKRFNTGMSGQADQLGIKCASWRLVQTYRRSCLEHTHATKLTDESEGGALGLFKCNLTVSNDKADLDLKQIKPTINPLKAMGRDTFAFLREPSETRDTHFYIKTSFAAAGYEILTTQPASSLLTKTYSLKIRSWPNLWEQETGPTTQGSKRKSAAGTARKESKCSSSESTDPVNKSWHFKTIPHAGGGEKDLG